MPRKNKYEFGNDGSRWTTFGKWLDLQRSVVGLTQEEAAAAAYISKRQWIRYTQGAVVPRKRIQAIASAIHVPIERVLKRARYEVSKFDVDVDAHLQRIKDALLKSDFAWALDCLFQLHFEMEQKKRRQRPPLLSTTRDDFIHAAVSFDRLPDWLKLEFGEYVLAVAQGASKKDYPLETSIQKKMRSMIKEELPKVLFVRGQIGIDEYKLKS